MLGSIGLPELIIIFLVVLLLFGAKALPEAAKGIAQAVKMFKKEVREVKSSLDDNPKPEDSAHQDTAIKDTSNDFDPNQPRRDWRPNETSDNKNA